jgi:hypothetical protein
MAMLTSNRVKGCIALAALGLLVWLLMPFSQQSIPYLPHDAVNLENDGT